ncbi:MAG: hypothetical protein ACKORM_03330 [Solirubrobacterales bacterium]
MAISPRTLGCAALTLGVVVFLGLTASSDASQKRLVNDLNHVTSIISEKRAEALYKDLKALGLPVAWKFSEYGPISSGGIRIGNLNFELGSGITPKAGDQFATFEPPGLKGLTARLDARGIKHGKPIPTKAGSKLLYTRVVLPTYSQENRITTQFCAYAFPSGKPTTKAPANRAGLINVSRVVINTRRPDSWAKLFAPKKPSMSNTYRLPSGPAVQLKKSRKGSIASIEVRVKKVARASWAFREVGIPVRKRIARLGTLRLRFVERG